MRLYKKLLLFLVGIVVISTFAYIALTKATGSRASAATAGFVQFREKTTQLRPDGMITMDILINNSHDIYVGTVTVVYPAGKYQYVSQDETALSDECKKDVSFPAVEKVINNPNEGKLTISRSGGVNGLVKPGIHCFTTIAFNSIGSVDATATNSFQIDMTPSFTFASDLQGNKSNLLSMSEGVEATVLGITTPPCMPTMDDTNCDGKVDSFDIKSPGALMQQSGLQY